MSEQQGRKIAIVGASGNIGGLTLNALREKGIHTITAVARAGSSATFPSDVIVKKGDYSDESFLVSAFQGQDVVVLQLSFDSFMAGQAPLIRAAAKAGVKWVLPTEFGSDLAPSKLLDASPLVAGKKQFRDLIEELGMSWVAIINNPWFDWSLAQGFWGIDIKNRSAKLFDGGKTKFITTTLGTTAKGTAGVLSLLESEPEALRNKPVYLKSFHISQRDMLDSILRATGTEEKDWKVEVLDAAAVVADCEEKFKQGDHLAMLTGFYVNHMREGWGGDYNAKAFDIAKLGVAEENLDEVVKRVVKEVEGQ
ncbi:pinoresinol reductase 2 [Colletotrichum spaethianum]|uniref:Pinoresinol reductase 2 n=1 Tax=Colletotrichum spaethianum TaxID=700344 RepID=A0AA37P9M1_9PEZI|nr:pinoresinol reductase 2 [Colletotrichum spaethianum]GKT48208.1 pinoresinol reductase 2 [Colletotrichum spaethianum]